MLDEEGEEVHPQAHTKEISQNWEAINAKLHYESEKQRVDDEDKQNRINIGEPLEEEQKQEHNNDTKDTKSFSEKRSSHYNEYFVLKAMRNAQKNDEDEEEEEL
jgi:hypothetical protein